MKEKHDIRYREKQLYKNTGILALGTLCSRAFQFLLLPLYTNVFSTEDYGGIDLLTTVASLIIPIITLQMSAGVFRFAIDCKDENDKGKIISTSFFAEVFSLVLSINVILVINSFVPIEHCSLFLLFIVANVYSDYVQNVIRGLGNNLIYSILSFITIAVSVLLNVLFILGFKMDASSILLASSISSFLGAIWATLKLKIWKYIKLHNLSKKIFKELIQYCLPLIPNAVSWWIANASDRLLIRIFLGASFNGVYAAANKIPALYTTIFNVFNLAWSEAVSRGSNNATQEQFVNQMLEKFIRMFGCICLGIIASISVFFNILIGSQYSDAYNHIWILMIAIFVNSICSVFGGIFTAFKKSKIIGSSTILGALINCVINILLISQMGMYAASISTLVSYIVILIVRYRFSKNLIVIKWPYKFLIKLLIATTIISIIYFKGNIYSRLIGLILLMIWSVINNKDVIITLMHGVKMKLLKNKGN